MPPNQDCADILAQNAARRLGLDLQYHYPVGKNINDEQLDIQAALIGAEGVDIRSSTAGFNEDAFLAMLNALDPSQIYAVRTGTNNGPGHYRLLYFEAGRWVSYSSETNYRDVTDGASGRLSQDGHGEFIVPNPARWGKADGQYSLLMIAMTLEVIKRVANYVYTYRTADETAAIAQAFTADQSEFRAGITCTKIATTSANKGHHRLFKTLPFLPPPTMSVEAYETFKQLYLATPALLRAIADTLPTLIRETTTEQEREIRINGVSIHDLLHQKCDDGVKASLKGLMGAGPI